MWLKKLYLKTYRSYREAEIIANPRFNLLIGNNAVGKTNLIEAIYLLSYAKTFRASETGDTVMWGEEGCIVVGEADVDGVSDRYSIEINNRRKSMKKNGKPIRRLLDLGIKSVLFAPEEVLLFRDQPQERRQYLDRLATSLLPKYISDLANYSKTLFNRNRLLKNYMETGNKIFLDEIKAWDPQLVTFGAALTLDRAELLEEVNGVLPRVYEMMAGVAQGVRMNYEPYVGEAAVRGGESTIVDKMWDNLNNTRIEEQQRGHTVVGPHRDDFGVSVAGLDLKKFGSQGEHRTAVLSLKIAEMELINARVGSYPIFLLDDVSSELDGSRNESFFRFLRESGGQVFISSTARENIRLHKGAAATIFQVEKGSVRPREQS